METLFTSVFFGQHYTESHFQIVQTLVGLQDDLHILF